MKNNYIKTGVIGHPVAHSKSPLIHNTWIAQYNLEGQYSAIDIPCELLEQQITSLIEQGYKGFNVTVPHKVAIMQLCSNIDDLAKVVGAVNTITITNGILYGSNSDVFGFTQNIIDSAPQFSFSSGAALVLGSGGAARAVVQGLITEGTPEIYIANRTSKNAEELLNSTSAPQKIKIIPWDERSSKKHLQNINILVNTTSLGMTGKSELDISLEHLPKFTLVNDIVYSPLITKLLKDAKTRGNPIVTGIGMLLQQARPSFKSWYGILPDITEDLYKKVLI